MTSLMGIEDPTKVWGWVPLPLASSPSVRDGAIVIACEVEKEDDA
jgi:hypothetical protein